MCVCVCLQEPTWEKSRRVCQINKYKLVCRKANSSNSRSKKNKRQRKNHAYSQSQRERKNLQRRRHRQHSNLCTCFSGIYRHIDIIAYSHRLFFAIRNSLSSIFGIAICVLLFDRNWMKVKEERNTTHKLLRRRQNKWARRNAPVELSGKSVFQLICYFFSFVHALAVPLSRSFATESIESSNNNINATAVFLWFFPLFESNSSEREQPNTKFNSNEKKNIYI